MGLGQSATDRLEEVIKVLRVELTHCWFLVFLRNLLALIKKQIYRIYLALFFKTLLHGVVAELFLCPIINHQVFSFPEMGHHTKTIIPVSIPTVPQLRPVLEAISRGSSPIPPEQVLFTLILICFIVGA